MRRGRFGLHVLGLLTLALALLVAAACTADGGPVLANPPAQPPSLRPPTPPPASFDDPQRIVLPRDDAPHDRLTEWWYYTGHLRSTDGRRFGFEYVVFRAERGTFPTSWVAHLAITDEASARFLYSQRLEVGPGVDRASAADQGAAGSGFDLAIAGADPTQPATSGRPAWTMTGANGNDRLAATLSPDEAALAGAPGGLGLDLRLRSMKTAAFHGGDGWIDFGPAGGSYYYSRTAMTARGTLRLNGRDVAIDGIAWFDHQWGDFISVGGGGWDWFAVNLEDGTDLTLSLVRDADGSYPLIYGTLIESDGRVRNLGRGTFTVAVTDRWTSPTTGASYPAAWTIELPGDNLTIRLRPTVAAQELDTRATTGVVYWEGSQIVWAARDGAPLGGEAYVELTGYAPSWLANR